MGVLSNNGRDVEFGVRVDRMSGHQTHARLRTAQRLPGPVHSRILLDAVFSLAANRAFDELREGLAFPKHSLQAGLGLRGDSDGRQGGGATHARDVEHMKCIRTSGATTKRGLLS